MLTSLLADVYLPVQSSTAAPEVDNLFNFLYWLSLFFFLIITGGSLLFAWKYRMKKGEAQRLTPGFANSTTLELLWTVIPTVLVVVIFVLGFQGFMRLYITPHNAYQINVTARQWGWTFTYPNGSVSTSLVLPAGRRVSLLMTSTDVIHSLFIPDFRVKMAVVPNRYTTLWFQSDEPGDHDLFCTEYCGDGHSRMYARVSVKSGTDFDKWIRDNEMPADAPPAQRGAKLFVTNQCNTCHSVDGSRLIGPTFKGIWGTKVSVKTNGAVQEVMVDENYLRDSIANPGKDVVVTFDNVMNRYDLNTTDMTAMIAYIQSLGSGAPPAPPTAVAPTSLQPAANELPRKEN